MSSEDQVKEQLSELLGTVEREEVAEWIDTAKIRLDPDQPWEEFLSEHKIQLKSSHPCIILCASGQRCADVLRLLQPYQPDQCKGHTAKLFAKHLKLMNRLNESIKVMLYSALVRHIE